MPMVGIPECPVWSVDGYRVWVRPGSVGGNTVVICCIMGLEQLGGNHFQDCVWGFTATIHEPYPRHVRRTLRVPNATHGLLVSAGWRKPKSNEQRAKPPTILGGSAWEIMRLAVRRVQTFFTI